MASIIASNFVVSGANDYVSASQAAGHYKLISTAPAVDLMTYNGESQKDPEDLSKDDLGTGTLIHKEDYIKHLSGFRIMSPEAFYRACFKATTDSPSYQSGKGNEKHIVKVDNEEIASITYNHEKNVLPNLLLRLKPII